jgi:hypothetical protein
VRAALIEERSRFCLFVAFLKPVVVSCILRWNKFLVSQNFWPHPVWSMICCLICIFI